MAKPSPLTRIFKFTLAWGLVFATALPHPLQAQAAAEKIDLNERESQSINKLRETISQVESLPDTAASKEQLTKAMETAYTLLSESEVMTKRAQSELEEITDHRGQAKNSGDQKKVEELRHRVQVLAVVINDLARFIGRNGGDYTAFFIVNPNDKPSEHNVKSGRISLPALPLTDADREDSQQQRRRMHSFINKAGSAALHFTNQYMTYSIATGIIAMSQLQFADVSNPNALELWINQTTDMMGAAGFMIFMAANHKVINMLKRVRSGVVPKSMIPYIGMAAGSLASSYFHDLWTDKDIWKCLRPYYNSKAKPQAGACQKAKETWIAGQHAKILQYAPTVISMLGSAALAGAFRSALTASGGPQALKNKYIRLVSRGVELIPKAQWARRAMTLATGVPGVIVAVGDFVIFIALDAYVLHEPVNRAWQNMRMHYFDPKAFLDNRIGLHSEVLFPKQNTYQLIDNALDVEATNLYSAHQYFMETLGRMQTSSWERPPPARACTPTEIQEGIQSGKTKQLKDLWFWQRIYQQRKSDSQLRCEVLARPADLFDRYASVNKEWRSILLNHYSMGQSNWLMMIEQFSVVYEASYTLAKHLAKMKFDMIESGSTERPNLSREALANLINAPLPTGDANEDRPEKMHETTLSKTALPTPELIDYVMASFACGPNPTTSSPAESSRGLLDYFYSLFIHQTTSADLISTPYGSNMKFTPPKITNSPHSICLVLPGKQDIENPFQGRFYDWSRDRRVYNSLADYVFDNIDPGLYRKIGINNSFENWWSEHVREPIAPVWEKYQNIYDRFIDENYTPTLFDKTFKHGCSGKDDKSFLEHDSDGFINASTEVDSKSQAAIPTLNGRKGKSNKKKQIACSDGPAAYRVANGVFLSLETEMRNYLRGLFSIYFASLPKKERTEEAKSAYLSLANQLIQNLKRINAETLISESYEEELGASDETMRILFTLVESSVLIEGGKNVEFRAEMVKKLKELLTKIDTEVLQHASAFHAMNFYMGPSARARAKTLNNDHGSYGNNRPVSLPAGRHGN